MGDPAGIGPEIVLKALENKDLYQICRPLIIGNVNVLEKVLSIINSKLLLNEIIEPCEGKYIYGICDVISINDFDINCHVFGKVDESCAGASYNYIKKTVSLALSGHISCVATAPINKEAINLAKINFIGHTEIFAELTETPDPITMFQVKGLRVFFLSRHVSLIKAIGLVKKEHILNYLIKCNNALKMLGIVNRKIAVAGLNPHNGENGLFGDEEITEIKPAVIEANKIGIKAEGPIPPDSVFHLALIGKYDAVLSLYHDQGHIATKTLDFERTISLTLGLPFLRTSVDHGTAFDIAGMGIARSISMEESIKLAALYSKFYKNSTPK